MARDEFSYQIKTKLAQRAGYLCSICGCLTIGPSEESEISVNLTGIAAHIASASPGGRRYNISQSPEQRTSIDNGIWLCSKHADLIDGDETTYTVEVLKRIKSKHELKVDLMHRGLQIENGLITRIDLTNFGSISNTVTLELTMRNLILGANGLGKTLICEMIASLANKEYLKRWRKRKHDQFVSSCDIHYYKNGLNKFSIAIDAKNQISYTLNNTFVPVLKAPFTVFYLTENIYDFRNRINLKREKRSERLLEEDDLLTWLSLYFDMDTQEFSNIINIMRKEKKFFINDIRINEKNNDIEVRYWGKPKEDFHTFWAFSCGERYRIILEIILKLATYYAKFQTTVLLLENTCIGTIDKTGLNKLLEIIKQENLGFQFVFTSFQKPEYFSRSEYTTYKLEKTNKNGIVLACLIK